MLNLLTGPAGCGKSEKILAQIKKLAANKERCLLIVPESDSHSFERRLLELCGDPAGRFAKVSTFSKLERDLLREAGIRPRSIDGAGRILYMYLALSKAAPALEYYKHTSKPRLISKMLVTVGEFTACRVTPQMLLEAVERDGLPPKMRDIALIYAAFLAEIEAGGLDPRDPFDIACAVMPRSGQLRAAHVFVDGFSGFTKQRYDALSRMLNCCGSLTVALMLDEADEALFSRQVKTRDALVQMAGGMAVNHEKMPDCGTPHSRLARRAFFRPAPGEMSQGARVRAYSCENPHEECRLAAALSRRMVLECGVRAREIAVICPENGGYADMLEHEFGRYGVPLFVSAAEDVLAKPPVAAALGGLAAVAEGLTHESVLDWLKSGLVGLTAAQCDVLENYALLWEIRGEQWFAPFEHSTAGYDRPPKDESERLRRINRLRELAVHPLFALREMVRRCKTGGDFARAMGEHLKHIRFEKRLTRRVSSLQGREPRLAAQYSQLARAVFQAVDQLDGALSQQTMDLRDFARLLRLALSQYTVDVIPISLDCAQVCTLERQPSGAARHIFILGAREGALPETPGGSGLFSESERIALETSNIFLTQTAEDMAFERQSNIYRAVARCKSLTLTAPRFSHDGGEMRESAAAFAIKKSAGISELPAGDELSAILPFAGAGENRQSPPKPQTAKITRPELISGLYGSTISMTASRVEQFAACKFSYFCKYGLKARERRPARFGMREIGSFVHEVVEQTVRDLSGPQSPPCDALQTRELTLRNVARTAEGFFKAKRVTARQQGIFDLLCESIADVVENVREEIEASDFKPLFFEMGFGREMEFAPPEIAVGGARAVVSGKIDRVDGWHDGRTLYLKVVDYKTGRKTFKLSDTYYGLNLQMFVYLLMLERAGRQFLEGQGARTGAVGGALYIPARSPWVSAEPWMAPGDIKAARDKELKRVGIVCSSPEVLAALEKTDGGARFLPVDFKRDGGLKAGSSAVGAHELNLLVRHTERVIGRLAGELVSGDVSVNPYRQGRGGAVCSRCEYASACHFEADGSFRFLPPMKDSEVLERLAAEEVDR